MHCSNAPCAAVCPTRALTTNAQGFVNFVNDSNEACIGCGLCVPACPFGIPSISAGKMHKCTGCEDLVSFGRKPTCVDTCIANALEYGPVNELIAKANQRLVQIREKYRDANLYGVTEQGGLGLLLILRVNSNEFPLIAG
jgi:formate dehydrogenase iron-sulfur subunit